jgi:hypothetical protein
MTASDHNLPPPDWFFAILEELGLRYAVRQTPQGEPYAGLRLATPSGRWLALTLIASLGTFRVTAHEIAADPGPATVATLNRALPMARCYAADPGTIDLAIDLYTGVEVLSGDQLGGLFSHLDESVTATLGAAADLTLPVMGGPGGVRDADLAGAAGGRVTAQLRPEGWLEVRAAPEPDILVADATAFATLDRLQNWTRAGKYLLTEAGSLRIAVLTPLLGHVPGQGSADPIGWSIDQATLMGQVARRHLCGP